MKATFSSAPFGPGIGTLSLGKPAAAFPAQVATDSNLMIAVDRQQTKLALTMNAGDTSMTVVDPSAIVANNLLSIDNEIVRTTGTPSGNIVPVARGFDGTVPAIHLIGATVSGFVDAWHHNTLVAEVEAIESALGANLSRIPASSFVVSSAYIFAPVTPNVPLTPGTNMITLSPVPQGVNGTDQYHYLWIDQGTGTPEAVLITGGSAVSGAASGTLFFTCANAHTGAWRISTATSGIQEAVQTLITGGVGGTVIVPQGNWPMHATAMVNVTGISLAGFGPGASVLTADLGMCPVLQIGAGAGGTAPMENQISGMTVTRAAGTIPTNCVGVLWNGFNYGLADNVEYCRHYIGEELTCPGASISIGFNSQRCKFWGNAYCHIWVNAIAGVRYENFYLGKNNFETAAPTYGVVISGQSNDIAFLWGQWLPLPAAGSTGSMQWGVLFNNVINTTGLFWFTECNAENITQGMFTSDAGSTNVANLVWKGGRIGNSSSTQLCQFNAATAVTDFTLMNASATGHINLTNSNYALIQGNIIAAAMAINGGSVMVVDNTFFTGPAFTGTFNLLLMRGNRYVFNASTPVPPDLSAASGQIIVSDNGLDVVGYSQVVAAKPNGPDQVAAATIYPPGNVFVLNGTAAVTTITPSYPGFEGVIMILTVGAVPFQTGGNIAANYTSTAGGVVIAAYSKSQGKWFLK